MDRTAARKSNDYRTSDRTGRFKHSQDGNATVEFAIWAPFFIFLMILVCEVSFLFTVNASMWNVARDVTRRLAYHQIEPSEAEARVLASAMLADKAYDVIVSETTEDVTLRITLPMRDASLMGLVVARFSGDLVAQITMLREPVQ